MFAVIGDIHGCYHTLKNLYEKVKETYGEIDVYATGDLVDRGNHSPEVIDFVMENDIRPVLGNHDRMFFCFFTDQESNVGRLWKYNASEKTMYDYQKAPAKLMQHLDFVAGIPMFYDLGGHLISHAGIGKHWLTVLRNNGTLDTGLLEKTAIENIDNDSGLLWNRAKILNVGKIQIVGHTPVPDFKYYKESQVYYIDTGAATGNKLTALIFTDEGEADVLFEKTDNRDVNLMTFR